MDKQYIEELRQLEDKKEAKAKLIEYAESFNIKVKKSKGFDALVVEIEEAFKVLAAEPEDETEGLSIGDLIDAADEAEGKFVQDDVKEEAALLFDGVDAKPVIVEVVEPVIEVVEPTPLDIVVAPVVDRSIPEPVSVPVEEKFKQPEVRVEAPIGEVVEPQPVLSENTLEEAVAQIVESEKPVFEIPEGFSPTLTKIGPGAGYCTLPWWIYDWIAQNPDWKDKPRSFPKAYGEDTIISLIYYIRREGQVRIRETRNSRFIVLN